MCEVIWMQLLLAGNTNSVAQWILEMDVIWHKSGRYILFSCNLMWYLMFKGLIFAIFVVYSNINILNLDTKAEWLVSHFSQHNCVIYFILATTTERFFRIDKAQEHLHYITDISSEDLYILDPALSANTARPLCVMVEGRLITNGGQSSFPYPLPVTPPKSPL